MFSAKKSPSRILQIFYWDTHKSSQTPKPNPFQNHMHNLDDNQNTLTNQAHYKLVPYDW